MNATHQIVLVGGGHAHVQTLARFARGRAAACRLCVVVDEPISVYSGMVPGFIAGQYDLSELEIDVGALARAAGAQLVVARALCLDVERQEITLDDGSRLPYDVASLDIGASVAGLDLPGVREHALPVRPMGKFARQVPNLLGRAREPRSAGPFTVVVVGGGAGGLELAFSLEWRLTQHTAQPARVVVIEAGERLLPGLPASLARRVHHRAVRRGVEVRLGSPVTAVTACEVELAGGERIPFHGLVWVAGPAGQSMFKKSGLPTDKLGFVRVRSTLQVQHHDNLFAAGDCATLIDHPRTPKAGVYAVRHGPILTHNLRAAITGTPLETFTPQGDFLTLLNLGDGTALGSKWGAVVEGRWVMRLKHWIDRRWVRQFSSRGRPINADTA